MAGNHRHSKSNHAAGANAGTLPRFLIADDGAGRSFVVHCHFPRFIIEFDGAGNGIPTMIDPIVYDTGPDGPVAEAAKLMCEAGDFFYTQIRR